MAEYERVEEIKVFLAAAKSNIEFRGAPRTLYRIQLEHAVAIIEELLGLEEGEEGG